MLESKIQLYLTLCEGDAALKEFARKRPIVIQYRIPDKEIQFYMAFKDGQVRTGMGEAESPATLSLTMAEKTFMGVMDGEIDGTVAALSGEMKFKGDPLKAMALQKIQKDLNRLWLEAGKPQN
jgi:putative sterol carrier protein